MNLLFILLLLACTEAKRRRPTQASDDEVYPQPFNLPVSFGNVYREGFVMPNSKKGSGQDDPLEDLADEKLPKKPYRPATNPEGFGNPRDEFLFNSKSTEPPDEPDGRMWFDFPTLQERNMLINNVNKRKQRKPKPVQRPPAVSQSDKKVVSDSGDAKTKYFMQGSFDLAGNQYQDRFKENWTTCVEFAKGASFHPEDIINNEWVPFYVWSYKNYLSVGHTFTIPTVKLVNEYKMKYGPLMDIPIDWEEPKLLMRALTTDTLLIAADRTGKFYGVIGQDLPDYVTRNKVTIPTPVMRFKIEDPYLAMMQCDEDEPYAAIMAVAGQEPADNQEKREAADTLRFRGRGLPVERNTELERQRTLGEKYKPILAEKNKRIYLHRNYGMFPPPGASQEYEPEFKEPKIDSIVPDGLDS